MLPPGHLAVQLSTDPNCYFNLKLESPIVQSVIHARVQLPTRGANPFECRQLGPFLDENQRGTVGFKDVWHGMRKASSARRHRVRFPPLGKGVHRQFSVYAFGMKAIRASAMPYARTETECHRKGGHDAERNNKIKAARDVAWTRAGLH